MDEMIPINKLAKMGGYDIKLAGDATIKTRVLGNATLIDRSISEWRSSLPSEQVIGVDVKYTTFKAFFGIDRPCLLILSTRTHCFIIQLRGHKFLPPSVVELLEEKSFCFVGMKSKLNFQTQQLAPSSYSTLWVTRFSLVELAKLAVRVLKNPGLIKCRDVSKVAKEVGAPYRKIKMDGKWDARVFSHEQVKAAMTDAYTCCVSASKLFTML